MICIHLSVISTNIHYADREWTLTQEWERFPDPRLVIVKYQIYKAEE